MRNIETFPSKQMYTYLSLVERKDVPPQFVKKSNFELQALPR